MVMTPKPNATCACKVGVTFRFDGLSIVASTDPLIVYCPLHEAAARVREALPDVGMLLRVAGALELRGITPASDVEKLRVAAHKIAAATEARP